jgi:hypothetical protein
MYVDPNFKTKKLLREAVAKNERVSIFSPGPFPANRNGIEYVEGPHFPKPHMWYATVEVREGIVVRVIN